MTTKEGLTLFWTMVFLMPLALFAPFGLGFVAQKTEVPDGGAVSEHPCFLTNTCPKKECSSGWFEGLEKTCDEETGVVCYVVETKIKGAVCGAVVRIPSCVKYR